MDGEQKKCMIFDNHNLICKMILIIKDTRLVALEARCPKRITYCIDVYNRKQFEF